MADLVERLMGVHASRSKIPVHVFQSVAAEWAAGKLTGAQAQAAIDGVTGDPLAASEVTEAQAIVALVTAIAVPAAPTGTVNATYANTQALRAAGKADRARKAQEIDQVLLLADVAAPGYDTPAAVRAKLGI